MCDIPSAMKRNPIFMCWHDLLFAHWPIGEEQLRPHIPPQLDVDTYDGDAWIGIVPFWMSGVRHHRLPIGMTFPELNVRTYVRHQDHRGVWFFSLDAASWVTVRAARAWFGLPYFDAKISCMPDGEAIHYDSRRTHRGAPVAALKASYRPVGEAARASAGSLEEFLVERYCLFSQRRGTVLKGDICHESWALQHAVAEFEMNTMLDGLRIELPKRPPILHFSKFLKVETAGPAPIPLYLGHGRRE